MRDLAESIYQQAHGQGVEGCLKTADDLARYRILLDRLRPALLVSLGAFSGKADCWMAEHGAGRVIGIDIGPQIDPDTRVRAEALPVQWVTGSTTDPAVVAHVAGAVARCRGHVLVIADSDHSSAHVAAELDAYSGFVTAGSYMVVEDTITRWIPALRRPLGPYLGSPADAADAFVSEHRPDWANDIELEDLYPTTQHPGGWLRRLR